MVTTGLFPSSSTVPLDTGESASSLKKYTWLSSLWMCHVVRKLPHVICDNTGFDGANVAYFYIICNKNICSDGNHYSKLILYKQTLNSVFNVAGVCNFELGITGTTDSELCS